MPNYLEETRERQACVDRLSAAREGVVAALEEIANSTKFGYKGAGARKIARAALTELEEASK